MLSFWLNLEMSQLAELVSSTLVALASTCGWLLLSGRP